MSKYDPGSGPYAIRYGLLTPGDIPDSFTMADWVHKQNEKQYQFYTRLEASVLKEGFRNPVMCYEKPGERTFPYGGSRVWMAWKLKIPVPALVSDWTGAFKHFELVTTLDQALAKFRDKPTVLEFHPVQGCQFWGCAQTHLAPEHEAFWKEKQRKNNASHLKRRMNDGQFYYADIQEKQSL